MTKRKMKLKWAVIAVFLAAAAGVLAFLFIPALQERISYYGFRFTTYARGVLSPAGEIPTPQNTAEVSAPVTPAAHETPALATALPTQSAPARTLPVSSLLPSPPFDLKEDIQDWNNCGPATLALALRMYGWQGSQIDISDVIKPDRQDRNVNIEELAQYVNQQAAPLRAEFRVAGSLAALKRFIAAGFPVVIEESFTLQESFWPGDDLWAAHYLLLTGYDDREQVFITQDSFYGPDKKVNYAKLEADWQSFNHVYMVIYAPSQLPALQELIGLDWQPEANRQRAVQLTQAALSRDPGQAFTWFNLGSSLTYLNRYEEAAAAFDKARKIGLPQRMLRYQFGPFVAAYQTHRQDDLLSLADYALQITPNAEEALVWKGWAYVLAGDRKSAAQYFQQALQAHPDYQEAVRGLEFILR